MKAFMYESDVGEPLTEEEITYSWIKRYWPREDVKAEDALDDVRGNLADKGITLKGGALIRILSRIWSVFERGGKTLTVEDKLDGKLLKKVSVFLGNNWEIIGKQLVGVASMLKKHDLHYGTQYYSLQGYEILATWSIIARIWQDRHSGAPLSELFKINHLCSGWIEDWLDRFVFACQRANSLGDYFVELSKLQEKMKQVDAFEEAASAMSEWFEKLTAQLDQRRALGAVALMDVTKALQDGRRVSIMFGRIDLERGDEEAAWIGDTLAKVCGNFHVDIAVCDDSRFNKIGLEICRRVRRIEKEGVPYGIAAGIKELGSESPYRGIDITNNSLDENALSVATARMESIVWNQNVWPVLVQLTDEQTMMGILAGHHVLPCDEEGRPMLVDAAVAFLEPDGSTSCGSIRSFKSEAVAIGVSPRPKPDWMT